MGIVFAGADWSGSASVYSMAGSVRFLDTPSGTHRPGVSLPIQLWRSIQPEPWNGTLAGTPWRRVGFGYLRERADQPNYTDPAAPVHKLFVPHWALFLALGAISPGPTSAAGRPQSERKIQLHLESPLAFRKIYVTRFAKGTWIPDSGGRRCHFPEVSQAGSAFQLDIGNGGRHGSDPRSR